MIYLQLFYPAGADLPEAGSGRTGSDRRGG